MFYRLYIKGGQQDELRDPHRRYNEKCSRAKKGFCSKLTNHREKINKLNINIYIYNITILG